MGKKPAKYLYTVEVEEESVALFKLNPATGNYEFEDGYMYLPGNGWFEKAVRKEIDELMVRHKAERVSPTDPRISGR